MAFTDLHVAVTIATLAAVEASGNYGVISAPDTLSLGIGQWTQGRAYDLLKAFPRGTSFGSTVDGWIAAGRDSWTIAARKYQYLSGADRSALSGQLDSATGHDIQDATMESDVRNSYIPRCRELGLDPDASPDAAILLMVVMHRWGNYGRILPTIVSSAGNPATIASMEKAIKYSGEYAMVPNRYKVAFSMVENHVTNGVKVGGATSTGGTASNSDSGETAGDNSDAGGTIRNDTTNDGGTVKFVREQKDGTLLITLGDDSKVTAFPTSVGYWAGSPSAQTAAKGSTPAADSSSDAPVNSGDTTAPSGTTDDRVKAMTVLARSSVGKYVYHQWFQPRLTPDTSGVTDCSGFCWWLFNRCLGVDIDRNGTASIFVSPTGKVIASGSGSFNATSKLREGDVIVCRWWSGGGHIAYVTGNGDELVSQNGPDGVKGPTINHAESMFVRCNWKVKRYV